MRTLPWRPVAAALALAAAGCGGGSADKDAFNQRKALCDALLATPSTPPKTPRDVAAQFAAQNLPQPLIRASSVDCFTDLLPVPSPTDTCQYKDTTTICSTFFEWIAGDQDLCDNGRCLYYCELRWQADQATVGPDQLSDAPICAERFVRGQATL
jgi:hypothetical protein